MGRAHHLSPATFIGIEVRVVVNPRRTDGPTDRRTDGPAAWAAQESGAPGIAPGQAGGGQCRGSVRLTLGAMSDPPTCPRRRWVAEAIEALKADAARSADTHLLKLDLPALTDRSIDIYLKDESTLPSGSLKHRLARSLFLYGLCNGRIGPDTPIIEASSGSTAISEAYFARMLGLRFVAVVPDSTAQAKLDLIRFHGGQIHAVAPTEIYSAAESLASELGGHYMDQFCNAERATDWRGNNNIAESMCDQMRRERHPHPAWIIVGGGTGGTSATIGRYIRYQPELACTRLAVVDPENSVFADFHEGRDASITSAVGSRIEGIGRPRVEPSFLPEVIDRVLRVPDPASIAATHWLAELTGRRFGASTGTNLWGVAVLASEMVAAGEQGSIVTLACDLGDRYRDTYFDDAWLEDRALSPGEFRPALDDFARSGRLTPP